MASVSTGATATTDEALSAALEELQKLMQEDECVEVAKLCKQLLLPEEDDEKHPAAASQALTETVRSTLYDAWIKALLREDDLEGAQKLLDSTGSSGADKSSVSSPAALLPNWAVLQAYVQYRRKRYEDTLSQLKGADAAGVDQQLLQAQAYYRIHKTKEAREVYASIVSTVAGGGSDNADDHDDDESMQVLTNALAVAVSNLTMMNDPAAISALSSSSSGSSSMSSLSMLQEKAGALLEQDTATSEGGLDTYPYDLAYNLGMLRVVTNQAGSASLLTKAKQAAIEQEGPESKEASSIQQLLDIVQPAGASASPDSVIGQSNAALQVSSKPKAFESYPTAAAATNVLYTPYQHRLYFFNKAVLALRANEIDGATEAIQELQQTLGNASGSTSTTASSNSKSKKKKGKNSKSAIVSVQSAASADDEKWWTTTVKVLEANVLLQKQRVEEAVQVLKDQKKNLSNGSSSSSSSSPSIVIDHAQATLDLWLANMSDNLSTPQQQLDALSTLVPSSLQSKPSVLATKAALMEQLGQDTTSLLDQLSDRARADFFMTQGEYDKAVDLYAQENKTGDEDDQMRYIRALSFVDPAQAQQEWDDLGVTSALDYESIDVEALEKTPLPRIKGVKIPTATTASGVLPGASHDSNGKNKNKRSSDSVLRRRTVERQRYLEQHPELQGRKPDPERWLPKHERSSNRRNRRHAHHAKGHQGGGVSAKDAAKLDVAARLQDGGNSGSGAPSTANMSVTSSYNSRKSKGGRRR